MTLLHLHGVASYSSRYPHCHGLPSAGPAM
jgi:hypothetical protein